MCVSFWTLFSFIDLYFYLKVIPHFFFGQDSFTVSLVIGQFFCKIILYISVPLHFHIHFGINLSISTKSLVEILIVMLNLYVDEFGKNWYQKILRLLTKELSSPLYSFRSSLISHNNVLQFSEYRFHAYFHAYVSQYISWSLIL